MNYTKLLAIAFAIMNVSIATLYGAQDIAVLAKHKEIAVQAMQKAGFSQEEIQALCDPK